MEKRSNTRIAFEVGANITYEKKTIECKVVNLSLNGVLLRSKENIPEKTSINIAILMEGTTSKLTVNLKGIVVRSSVQSSGSISYETAVEFKSIDLDSFIHLKNIVAYNEGDEEKIMNEFYNRVKN